MDFERMEFEGRIGHFRGMSMRVFLTNQGSYIDSQYIFDVGIKCYSNIEYDWTFYSAFQVIEKGLEF